MSQSGRWISLSPARRLIGDLLHASRAVPALPMERRMHLASVVAARRDRATRIGWCAIFIKAFAIVAAQRAELRRAFLTIPWTHLYEHPESVAGLAVERRYGDEDAVFFALLRGPENRSLADIQGEIDRAKNLPIESIKSFRRALRVSQWPKLLRRFVWWLGLNLSGKHRARFFGTFSVSATAALGASALFVLSPLTATIHYGPLDHSGSLDVRLIFDHRVLDGATIARAMADLEAVLCGEICAELAGRPLPKPHERRLLDQPNSGQRIGLEQDVDAPGGRQNNR